MLKRGRYRTSNIKALYMAMNVITSSIVSFVSCSSSMVVSCSSSSIVTSMVVVFSCSLVSPS